MTPFRAPLDVVGEVQALFADETVLVTAAKNTITVDVPSLRTGLAALKGVGGRRRRAKTIRRASGVLDFADLTVDIRIAGATLATLGADAHPGLLSWLLGLRPLEIRLSGIASYLRTLWR